MESNIDDTTGEVLGFTLDELIKKGARDVFYTPIYMKKNRPAYKLSVICSEQDVAAMETVIFKNTTTIGIRKYKASRRILKREMLTVNTEYGPVRVKACTFEDQRYYYPEYEDVKAIAHKTGLGLKTLYDAVKKHML